VATAGSADAQVQKLELRLPRRYAKVALTCRSDAKARVACRITSRTVTAATGARIVVLKLPSPFTAVRIACGTFKTTFGCKLQK
jgi:hypothetical protein